MRTLLMTLALMIGIGTMAQNTDKDKLTVEQRAHQKTVELTKELGLSADQATKLEDVTKTHMRNMEAVKQMPEGKARDARADGLKANRDASYKKILTADQFQKLEQIRDDKKDQKEGAKKH